MTEDHSAAAVPSQFQCVQCLCLGVVLVDQSLVRFVEITDHLSARIATNRDDHHEKVMRINWMMKTHDDDDGCETKTKSRRI